VSYETLVHRPEQILPQIADLLGASEKFEAMRACIDPNLHRTRKNPLPSFDSDISVPLHASH